MLAESTLIRDQVTEELGFPVSVTADSPAGVDVLNLTVTSNDQATAQLAANTFASIYLDTRRDLATQDYREAAEVVQDQLDEVTSELSSIDDVADEFDRRQALATQREILIGQLQQLNLNAELGQGGSAQLISPAQLPLSPLSPRLLVDGSIAIGLALLLGGVATLAAENLDNAIRSKDDLEEISGLPALAVVPEVKGGLPTHVIVGPRSVTTPASESILSLRTSVRFLDADERKHAIMLTSAHKGEGKSTTATNLAVALSLAGEHVCLVDLDLRRPRVHEYLGLPLSPGVTDLANGNLPLKDLLARSDDYPLLQVLAAGAIDDNPTDILGSDLVEKMMEALVGHFDRVIIDAPPVLPVADALIISRLVDAVIVLSLIHI